MADPLDGFRGEPGDLSDEELQLKRANDMAENVRSQYGVDLSEQEVRFITMAAAARDFMEGVAGQKSRADVGLLLCNGLLNTGATLLDLIEKKKTLDDDEVRAAANLFLGARQVLTDLDMLISKGDEIEKQLDERD